MCPSHISGCIDSNVGQTSSGMRGFVHFCIQVLSCIHHALHIGTAMLISADDTGRCNTYGEMSGHQSCKSYSLFVSKIPSHDLCCAYLERHNMILFVNYL